jgi:hypothetical protein
LVCQEIILPQEFLILVLHYRQLLCWDNNQKFSYHFSLKQPQLISLIVAMKGVVDHVIMTFGVIAIMVVAVLGT